MPLCLRITSQALFGYVYVSIYPCALLYVCNYKLPGSKGSPTAKEKLPAKLRIDRALHWGGLQDFEASERYFTGCRPYAPPLTSEMTVKLAHPKERTMS